MTAQELTAAGMQTPAAGAHRTTAPLTAAGAHRLPETLRAHAQGLVPARSARLRAVRADAMPCESGATRETSRGRAEAQSGARTGGGEESRHGEAKDESGGEDAQSDRGGADGKGVGKSRQTLEGVRQGYGRGDANNRRWPETAQWQTRGDKAVEDGAGFVEERNGNRRRAAWAAPVAPLSCLFSSTLPTPPLSPTLLFLALRQRNGTETTRSVHRSPASPLPISAKGA